MLKKTLFIGAIMSVFALAGCSTEQTDILNTGKDSTNQSSTSASTSTETLNAENVNSDGTSAAITEKIDFETMYPDNDIRNYAKGFIGQKAPDFKLTNLEGKEVQLSDFKGKNLILEIAQTTCSACIQTQPEIDKFKKDHPDLPLVQVFPMENSGVVREFLTKLNSPEHKNILTGDKGNTFVRDYKAKWTPTLYFINKDGVISFLHVGSTDADFLLDMTKRVFE
ncbi:TlpA family protein disulfide reductase [Brevibacillus sp. NPDC058079]|uniref:TlpA family protein disulfide reductase n=1 Tax=Brevibacillus sp. NPDC058079 TaxID=3346330 RepID=UPI0036E3A316